MNSYPTFKGRMIKHKRFGDIEPMAKTKKDQVQDKQIKSLKKKVKKIEYNEETLFNDSAQASVNIVETGALVGLGFIPGLIQQGDGDSQRTGDQISTTSLLFRGTISSATAKLTPSFVRMIVFWDSQANGAAPSVSGTANSLMLGSATVPGHLDFRNQDTIKRFSILYDKTYVLQPQQYLTDTAGTITANEVVSKYISKRIKLGRKIYYSGSTGAAADLVSNNICIAFISDNTTNPPILSYNCRLYYKDT